jgi:hypothetical protein
MYTKEKRASYDHVSIITGTEVLAVDSVPENITLRYHT